MIELRKEKIGITHNTKPQTTWISLFLTIISGRNYKLNSLNIFLKKKKNIGKNLQVFQRQSSVQWYHQINIFTFLYFRVNWSGGKLTNPSNRNYLQFWAACQCKGKEFWIQIRTIDWISFQLLFIPKMNKTKKKLNKEGLISYCSTPSLHIIILKKRTSWDVTNKIPWFVNWIE